MKCPTRPFAPLRSAPSLLSSLFSSPPARISHPRLRFVSLSRTTRFCFSTLPSKNRPSSVATRPSAAMDPRAPEPDPNSAEDFVHIEDPNPNMESLSESFVGVDVAREEAGDEADYRRDGDGGDGDGGDGGDGDGGDGDVGSDRRRTLPEELSRSVVVLNCESLAEGGTCDVYLVGTAHVSEESCREVEAVISYLKPQVVFLELCPSRVAVLTPQNLKVPTFGEMVEMYKKKHNAFGILYSWFLAKVANKLEVFPGAEFRVAFEEAMKYGGKVILGDRPVQVTLRRTWGKMPLWHKTKLIYSLLFQAVFLPSPEDLNKMLKDLDNVDMLTLVIQEMSKEFPTLMETLVHERDQYMSCTLLKVAKEHSSVVAVVGKGHLGGIKKHWKQPVAVKDLLEVPSKKPAVSTFKMLSSLGVAVAGVAILSGIYFGWKK